MNTVRLTIQPFEPGAELSGFCAGRTESGAVASFVGIARGDAGATTALELEAYPGFTEAEIGRMAQAATERFALHDALVVHRHGPIAPGDAIVLVATAAAHRREAFEACDYLMDYLKSRAPFWKKEHGPAGARWVEPTPRDLDDLARWTRPPPSWGGAGAGGLSPFRAAQPESGSTSQQSTSVPPPPTPPLQGERSPGDQS